MCVCVLEREREREREHAQGSGYPQHSENNISKLVVSPVSRSFSMDVALRVIKPNFILC